MPNNSLSSSDQEARQERQQLLALDTRRAIVGGVVAAVIAALGILGIRVGSGIALRGMLQAMLPSTRFLCSAVMTATATILALMLTLLSFSSNTDRRIKSTHYERVRQIALIDSIVFIGAIFLLLFITIPLEESLQVPDFLYSGLYYVILVYSALLGGALITIVLMLYNAVKDLISIVHPAKESGLVVEDDAARR